MTPTHFLCPRCHRIIPIEGEAAHLAMHSRILEIRIATLKKAISIK